MATKYFDKIPKYVAGLIFIIGSMLDAVAITSIIQKETVLAISFIALRAGVTEFRRLYENQTHERIG